MTRRRFRVLSTLVALSVAAACAENGPTVPSNLPLSTDSTSYTAIPIGAGQVLVKLVTRYRNITSAPVRLDKCSANARTPIFDVVLVSPPDTEGAGYDAAQACTGTDPFIVAPGETRTDTLRLVGPTAYDTRTKRYLGTVEGKFRVAYGGQESNEFTIELPPEGAVPLVPRDLGAVIQTDSLLYQLSYEFGIYKRDLPIHVSIYNPRADTSFIINCGGATGLYLEKQTGSTWTRAWTAVVPQCLSMPFVIPPNGHYATLIDLFGAAKTVNAAPQFAIDDIPGVYRFVWTQIVDSFTTQPLSAGAPASIELRRSNPFAIVVRP